MEIKNRMSLVLAEEEPQTRTVSSSFVREWKAIGLDPHVSHSRIAEGNPSWRLQGCSIPGVSNHHLVTHSTLTPCSVLRTILSNARKKASK